MIDVPIKRPVEPSKDSVGFCPSAPRNLESAPALCETCTGLFIWITTTSHLTRYLGFPFQVVKVVCRYSISIYFTILHNSWGGGLKFPFHTQLSVNIWKERHFDVYCTCSGITYTICVFLYMNIRTRLQKSPVSLSLLFKWRKDLTAGYDYCMNCMY